MSEFAEHTCWRKAQGYYKDTQIQIWQEEKFGEEKCPACTRKALWLELRGEIQSIFVVGGSLADLEALRRKFDRHFEVGQ